MADAKIMTFGELFSATTDVIPDNKAAAVEIEGLDGNDYIKINTTNSSEAVQLVSSGIGRVSIGTHDPYTNIDAAADNLVVGDGTGDEGITIVCGSSAGDYGSVYFGDPSSGTQGQIRYEQNNEVMSFYTNTAERMRIDLDGDVGIGTTTVAAKLDVTDGGNDYTSGLLLRNGTSTSEATSLYHDNTGSTSTVLANRYGSASAAIKLVLQAAGSPVTALTALGNGKVGIGNDSPTKNLSIVNPDGEVQLELRSNAEDTNAVFYLGTPHDPGAVNKTAIIAKSDVGYSQSDLHFCLNNTDDNTTEVSLSDSKMTIDTDGNVMITGDAAPVLEIRDDRDNPGATDLGAISFTSSDASAGDDYCASIVCESIDTSAKPDGALRFTMFENGTANGVVRMENNGDVDNTTGAYGTISDERIKENITDAPSQWDDLKSIQFRKYNLINNDKAMIGCVAQELESVCPGLVSTAEGIRESQGVDIEGLKSVKQSILFMKGMKALQEAILRIEVLESRLNEGN